MARCLSPSHPARSAEGEIRPAITRCPPPRGRTQKQDVLIALPAQLWPKPLTDKSAFSSLPDLSHDVMDNFVYSLTKKQTSPRQPSSQIQDDDPTRRDRRAVGSVQI